jgi:hypothetical protein
VIAPAALVFRDGQQRRVALSADGQSALYARVLFAGAEGLVEVAGAERLRDGRLRFAGRRQDAADYVRANDVRAFVQRVRRHREEGREVFASPLPRGRAEPTNAAVPGGRVLWVDLDGVEVRTGLRRLEPMRPHLVVASGGGLHAYWLCGRELRGDEIESANRRLAARLEGDLAVANRGRILRVPGTLNRRRSRACTILRVDLARPRVSYERLAATMPDPRPARSGRQNGRPRLPRGVFDPAEDLSPREYFRLLCGVEPNGAGYVLCPLPQHRERTPSCRLFEDHWWCFGCARGGGIYDLASLLHGGPWGTALRGAAFSDAARIVGDRQGASPARIMRRAGPA